MEQTWGQVMLQLRVLLGYRGSRQNVIIVICHMKFAVCTVLDGYLHNSIHTQYEFEGSRMFIFSL